MNMSEHIDDPEAFLSHWEPEFMIKCEYPEGYWNGDLTGYWLAWTARATRLNHRDVDEELNHLRRLMPTYTLSLIYAEAQTHSIRGA